MCESCAVFADGLAVHGQRVFVDLACLDQLGDDGGNTAGAVIVLAQILAGRLQVDQQRYVEADLLPIVMSSFDADVAGDGVQMDWARWWSRRSPSSPRSRSRTPRGS